MEIREIGEKECQAVLQGASIGRLGCALDNQPYVVPVYFAYEADYVYLFSTLGQKIEWMRANPKVCLQADEIKNQLQWVSVIANGRYEELPTPQYEAELAHARVLLKKRHSWWLNAMAERRKQVPDELIAPLFFRIHIESMTGLAAVGEGEMTSPPRK